jgi:cohesin loading factor subunit SCC2
MIAFIHFTDSNYQQWLEETCQKTSSSRSSWTNRFEILRQGLQAATILLSIMISPSIDRRVFNEDVIESIIALMRSHIVNHIIPSLSCTGHTASYACNDAPEKEEEEEVAAPRKKQKVTKKEAKQLEKDETAFQQSLIKFLKKIYSGISSTVGLLTNLIERLDLLVHVVSVDDQPLLSICASALSSLTIDPAVGSGSRENTSLAHAVQMACVSLITTIFRKHPKHRIVILEDLFPLLLKIPTSKRSMRTFPVRLFLKSSRVLSVYGKKSSSGPCRVVTPYGGQRGDGQDFIQVMTVLILSMIQACVTMPYSRSCQEEEEAEEVNGSKDDQKDLRRTKRGTKQHDKRLSSGLAECDRTCKIFTTLLIQRCSKKGEEGGASEFRPILSNLVEDLLLVQMLPQFPSAETLLLEICRKLCDDLVANSAVGNGKKAMSSEATYLTTAMDTVGTICSDTAAKISLARENPLVFAKEVDIEALNEGADPSTDSKEVNRCSCGRTTLVDTFMLDCDRCHNWFHGSCVGIAKDKLPDVWICDECTMQIMVVDQMKVFCAKINDKELSLVKSQGKMDLTQEDKVHIMRVLLLNFLTHQEKLSHSAFSSNARQFHLARFVKDINIDKKSSEGNVFSNFDLIQSHFLDMWDIRFDGDQTIGAFSQNYQQCEYLSEEGNAKLMLTLNASKSQLVASLPQLLGVIVALMGDENNVSLRKLAVKALSQIVQTDSSLMAQRSVREAATKRFSDEAISVREAAVSLVGFYVLQTPEAAKAFHIPLLLRLNDEGISVVRLTNKYFLILTFTFGTYLMFFIYSS